MAKIFLSGPKKIGKSTIINKVITLCGFDENAIGGFITRFCESAEGGRSLYMQPASLLCTSTDGVNGDFDTASCVVAQGDYTGMHAITGAFDTSGSQLLNSTCKQNGIVILDELGYLEGNELTFKNSVINTINNSEIVLGVIREGFPGWTKEISLLSDVLVIEVDESNRDYLPSLIAMKILGIELPSAVIMASGHGKRFGGKKLLAEVNGVPMIENLFKSLPAPLFKDIFVVTADSEITALARKYSYTPIYNDDLTDDMAITIKYGVSNIKDSSGCMLIVSDQPYLKTTSFINLINAFIQNHTGRIIRLSYNGCPGNPVIFPKSLLPELASLNKNEQGKIVIKRHSDLLCMVEAVSEEELADIDYVEDLKAAIMK